MYGLFEKAVDRLPELGVMSPHIVMVENVGRWAEYVVTSGPKTSREADLLSHEYPREKRIERYVLEPD